MMKSRARKRVPLSSDMLLAKYQAALRKPRPLSEAEIASEMKPFNTAILKINTGHGVLDDWKLAIRAANLVEYARDHSGMEAEGLHLMIHNATLLFPEVSKRIVQGSTGLRSTERETLLQLLGYLAGAMSVWTDHELAEAAAFCDNVEVTMRQDGKGLPLDPRKNVK